MDGIEEAMAEQPDGLEIEAMEADIRVTFKGTNREIRSRPRVTPGCPEPTREAKVVA